eukprot:TRINITY_DN2705_c0_g1_i2.p1 TRINITY_DN2705_c0_g1~~TRINITY_DN2705_c0_g1_i2.p1  ORF type:complete len:115 (+),score=14.32 TRINITY_DN2705_c0_g1_i2:1-345(+)
MSGTTSANSIPQESINNLNELQDCLSEVAGRLEAKKTSVHVTRFPEKNLLVHGCINFYDAWHKYHSGWVLERCHLTKDPELCDKLTKMFEKKNTQVQESFFISRIQHRFYIIFL